jgi:hypothetical protein
MCDNNIKTRGTSVNGPSQGSDVPNPNPSLGKYNANVKKGAAPKANQSKQGFFSKISEGFSALFSRQKSVPEAKKPGDEPNPSTTRLSERSSQVAPRESWFAKVKRFVFGKTTLPDENKGPAIKQRKVNVGKAPADVTSARPKSVTTLAQNESKPTQSRQRNPISEGALDGMLRDGKTSKKSLKAMAEEYNAGDQRFRDQFWVGIKGHASQGKMTLTSLKNLAQLIDFTISLSDNKALPLEEQQKLQGVVRWCLKSQVATANEKAEGAALTQMIQKTELLMQQQRNIAFEAIKQDKMKAYDVALKQATSGGIKEAEQQDIEKTLKKSVQREIKKAQMSFDKTWDVQFELSNPKSNLMYLCALSNRPTLMKDALDANPKLDIKALTATAFDMPPFATVDLMPRSSGTKETLPGYIAGMCQDSTPFTPNPLLAALGRGNIEAAKLLLEQGANVNYPDLKKPLSEILGEAREAYMNGKLKVYAENHPDGSDFEAKAKRFLDNYDDIIEMVDGFKARRT